MSTLQLLKQNAVNHFAKHGYEGTSLALIAEDVGIKKQSIYTYYKGKDELFLSLFEEASNGELTHISNMLKKRTDEKLHDFLYTLLENTIERFDNNARLKFLITSGFLPPAHLQIQINRWMGEYIDALQGHVMPIFKAHIINNPAFDAQTAATAFIALLDSLYVEMLYGNRARVQARLQASYLVFWTALQHVITEE